MTPEEKWERLTNPKTIEDYGLRMSENELMQFPEGQRVVAEVRARQEERSMLIRSARAAGKNTAATIDSLILRVLGGKE